MSEELEAFIEDTTEHLHNIEDSLLELQEGYDQEAIKTIFRAMHTIKGGASMFDYKEVIEFSHKAESLLALLRDGKLSLDDDILELLLSANDHINLLFTKAVDDQPLSLEEQNTHKELTDFIESFLSTDGTTDKPNPLASQPQEDTKQEIDQTTNIWHISLRLHEDFFESGMDITSIFSFFSQIAKVDCVVPVTQNIPYIESITPLTSYIGFEFQIEADMSIESIYSAFEFIENDIDIICFITNDLLGIKELLSKREDENFEQLLRDKKLFPKELLAEALNSLKEIESTQTQQDATSTKQKTTQKSDPHTTFLKVDARKIDELLNRLSDMVITNARMQTLTSYYEDDEVAETSQELSEQINSIRDNIMNIRMVQVDGAFKKFKRIVRETAKNVSKDIKFEIIGGETELDKNMIEKINDPIIHMLRNSIDHGIESSQERVSKGKQPKGSLWIKAYTKSDSVVIEIGDDGAGLDKRKIYQKALDKQLILKTDTLTDSEIYNLIFSSGLSTAKTVSDLSGRGVGMEVVKKNIEDLGGKIYVDSKENKGATFTLEVPLTMAIIDGFLIKVAGQPFIVPMKMLQETLDLHALNYQGEGYLRIRDSYIDILELSKFFQMQQKEQIRKELIIVNYNNKKMGLIVDQLVKEQQVVIKSFGEIFSKIPGILGGSLLGDGTIAIILDIPTLIETTKEREG